MPLFAWLALVFLILALAAATTVLVVRGLRAWRAFGAFGRSTGDAMGVVLERAEKAEQRALSLTAGGERLNGAIARLQESLAELAALRSALGEAQALSQRLRGVVPRK